MRPCSVNIFEQAYQKCCLLYREHEWKSNVQAVRVRQKCKIWLAAHMTSTAQGSCSEGEEPV